MTREERENAIKVIKNYDLNFHKINGLLFKAEEIANAFDCALEALEQEPKIGHWILDETDNSITCDKCGCLIWANDIHNGEAYYCPNCGAKMEG